MGYKNLKGDYVKRRRFYIKYLGLNSIHHKYAVYEKNKLITEFISSEELNLRNKAAKREALEEIAEIIEKYDIKGI